MRRVLWFGKTRFQKKCNHSIDTAGRLQDAALRDFSLNCEHAVEPSRVLVLARDYPRVLFSFVREGGHGLLG
jgi:hypothetical protein